MTIGCYKSLKLINWLVITGNGSSKILIWVLGLMTNFWACKMSSQDNKHDTIFNLLQPNMIDLRFELTDFLVTFEFDIFLNFKNFFLDINKLKPKTHILNFVMHLLNIYKSIMVILKIRDSFYYNNVMFVFFIFFLNNCWILYIIFI